MNEKNVIPWKIKDFSYQNMCFLYFVASNWGLQSLVPKYKENCACKPFEFCVNSRRLEPANSSHWACIVRVQSNTCQSTLQQVRGH